MIDWTDHVALERASGGDVTPEQLADLEACAGTVAGDELAARIAAVFVRSAATRVGAEVALGRGLR